MALVTPPWVAQRVWPIPHVELLSSSQIARRSFTFPTVFRSEIFPVSLKYAIPALSYPRYSRLASPVNKTSWAFNLPVNPIIPHIIEISFFSYNFMIPILFSFIRIFFIVHYVVTRKCYQIRQLLRVGKFSCNWFHRGTNPLFGCYHPVCDSYAQPHSCVQASAESSIT